MWFRVSFIPTRVALLFLPIIFFESIGVAIALTLCKQNSFLCSWCTHNTLTIVLQIMESFLTTPWIFILPSCVFVTQIRSEFRIYIGVLFQEDVYEVPFLCIRLNFNILIIRDVLIRCTVCVWYSLFQNNWMVSCDSNVGSNINLGVEYLIPLVISHGVLVKNVGIQLLLVYYGEGILILRLLQHRIINDAD